MENCSVKRLKEMTKTMEFDKQIKPYKFNDGSIETRVSSWTDLSVIFVKWLIQNNYLTTEKLPIPNDISNGKYFINSRPIHKISEKDGLWHHVGPYFIDTKYNATRHMRNILYALKHLGVSNPQITISFRLD